MLALTPLSAPPTTAGALVLLREPTEVGADAPLSRTDRPAHAAVNHLQRIRHHASASLEGCLGFVLGSLKAFGTAPTIDALARQQTTVLRARGIATKDQLLDLLATAQAQDLLTTLVCGVHASVRADHGTAPAEAWGTLHSRPAAHHLPAFMKAPQKHPGPAHALGPREHQGRGAHQLANQVGLALAGHAEAVRKAVDAWLDPGLGVPEGVVAQYARQRLEENSGRAGLAHLLARDDLGDCIDQLRTSMPLHVCAALERTGPHLFDVVLGLARVADAGRRVLGIAFALGKDEVQAQLAAKGGWASHSLLMGGLAPVPGHAPEGAWPCREALAASALPRGGWHEAAVWGPCGVVPTPVQPDTGRTLRSSTAGVAGSSTAGHMRAAPVVRDVVRLATLLTVYDIWGVAVVGTSTPGWRAPQRAGT